ncbi:MULTISPECIES: DUF1392 family protein [unclassified Nostoc]|uniref:DUF1392 family protein n=1 Tax=unclassified Nostoc TaxID=2593658 RepID=UPI002AD3A100|nr:DUF1392 family protein [Nostoc sp. DedQUE03]MDZ7977171.1 DUF1392 family protein [Nostoc sp. DedQUE03]MDZ8044025.1 DUF1392 family protein [Nostoc sp. DedQUE02]
MADSHLLPKQQQALEKFLAGNAPTPLLIQRVGGRSQSKYKEKPVFRLGELVEFRFHGDGPSVRIVQGIQLINDCWFYSIE